ncbi:trypsin-like serine peptidase [Pseudomonas sp. NPDC090202]|uniref:trypsin-like serine peptidase n=1 Tax=unclassified Pseudomonas TaxID=196821 RepID=UPI00380F6D42
MKLQLPLCILATTLSLVAATTTCATDYAQGLKNLSAPIALDNAQGQYNHWRSIGRLQMSEEQPEASCTAWLLDSRDSNDQASGPAYVATSGHCVIKDALNVAADVPMDGHIDFDYFLGNLQNTRRYTVKKASGASLRGVDIAIIELDAPLQDLLDIGIEPLKISTETPMTGMDLMIVGNPSGHADAPGLRLSTCALDSIKDFVEGIYVSRAAQKNLCLGIAPGSSGSPVLDRHSNRVIGIIGTTTRNTREESRCYFNTPCEINDGEAVWSAESNYSSPVTGLQSCFKQGRFDPSDTHCPLQPVRHMTVDDETVPISFSRITVDEHGNDVIPTWSFAFSLDTPFYRYKIVRSPSACIIPTGYSDAIASTDAHIDDPIGPTPGMHMLCIIGVESQEQRPAAEMMNKPFIVSVELVEAGPSRLPWLAIERVADGYQVTPQHAEPWFFLYAFKAGAPDETDCDDQKGYAQEDGEPLKFATAQLPVKLCSIVVDLSMQRSAPRTDLLEP